MNEGQLKRPTIYNAVHATNQQYPYLAYGTDWLAFGHLVIAPHSSVR